MVPPRLSWTCLRVLGKSAAFMISATGDAIVLDACVQLAAVFVLADEGLEGGAHCGHQSARRAGLRIARISTPKALTPAPAMMPGQGLTMTPAGRTSSSMSRIIRRRRAAFWLDNSRWIHTASRVVVS